MGAPQVTENARRNAVDLHVMSPFMTPMIILCHVKTVSVRYYTTLSDPDRGL